MLDDAAPGSTAPAPSPASGSGAPGVSAPPTLPTAGEAQSGDDAEEIKDPGALLRSYRALQAAEKTQRNRLAQLEAAAKRAEDAKLSDQERLQKRVAELESQQQNAAKAAQEKVLRYEVQLQAARLNIVDPDAAAKLLDMSQVSYDADGQPQGVEAALAALIDAKPYLVSSSTGAGSHGARGAAPATPASASPTNPATRSSTATATRRYSQAELTDRDFYLANRDDIIRAHREGRID
jgi:multidrug efflux pump subunit AcrA (membrane-fusion protein)